MDKRGWYSRGHLPHFDAPDFVQMVTFHHADALPRRALDQVEAKLDELPEGRRKAERRRRLERWLDAGHESCHLGWDDIATIVQDRLLAWCVMPNHVHVVCELSDDVELWKAIKGRKGSTALHANRRLGREGAF